MRETPEHVEKHPSGITMCRHCGGEVAEDGYSAGGLIMDGDHAAESEIEAAEKGDTGELPQQYQAVERMRDAAFADAIKRRSR